jgi:hypothetical protein
MDKERLTQDPSVLSRRAFFGIAVAGLVGNGQLAEAKAQTPPASEAGMTLADQLPGSTTIDPKTAAEIDESRARERESDAKTQNFDADTRLKIQQADNNDSWFSQAKELVGPLTAFGTVASIVGGALLALRQHRQDQATHAATNALEVQRIDNATFNAIADDLKSENEPTKEAAARKLLGLAASEYLSNQLQVFNITRGVLRKRKTDTPDPRHLTPFERDIIEAFFAVLPNVHESGARHKSFSMGEEEWEGGILDATGINLSGVELAGKDLRWVNLTHARFQNAQLIRCNLDHTVLNGTDLRGADIVFMGGVTETNFKRVLLQGADMRNAMIRTRYLNEPSFYEQIYRYVKKEHTKGLILLGDSELSDEQLQQLIDRGAIHVPRGTPEYHRYRQRTRVESITQNPGSTSPS